MASMYTVLLMNVLFGINYLGRLLEDGAVFINTSIKGAVGAHYPDIWIFLDRNTIPWVVKNEVESSMKYYPSNHSFVFTGNEVDGKMDDVVIAELKKGGDLILDMTSFFHSVRWMHGSPSLYEVVLTGCLLSGVLKARDNIQSYTLEVMTAEADTLQINLSDNKTKMAFTGWNLFRP